MNRRQFIRTGAAGLGAAALGFAGQAGNTKPLRVGLIGCGWYGKCDLFRLIQVSPVEVVSLCDVDRRMLSDAAEMVSTRQPSHKKPSTSSTYRTMLSQKHLRTTSSCIRAAGAPSWSTATASFATCASTCST